MQKRINIWVVATCVLLMIMVFGIANARIATATKQIDETRKEIEASNQDLANENRLLEEQLELSKTDAFIEQYAREHYDCMMDGELRFVITFPDENTAESDPSL